MMAFATIGETYTMLICVNTVEACDARDDDSSNAADKQKKRLLKIPHRKILHQTSAFYHN